MYTMHKAMLLFVVCLYFGDLKAQDHLQLEWTLEYERDGEPGIMHTAPATVPGAVQLDIARAEGYGPFY